MLVLILVDEGERVNQLNQLSQAGKTEEEGLLRSCFVRCVRQRPKLEAQMKVGPAQKERNDAR